MIRTLQDHGIHMGIDVHMECTVTRLLTEDGRIVGAFGYHRDRGRFKFFRAKSRRARNRWNRPRVPDYEQPLGIYG